jgi:hypothetical protein
VLIDTSVGKQPLRLILGNAHGTLLQQEASGAGEGVEPEEQLMDKETSESKPSKGLQEDVDKSIVMSGESSVDGSEAFLGSSRREKLDDAGVGPMSFQAALGNNRFRSPLFAMLLDQVTPKMVVGEKRSVAFHNPLPEEGGFFNPGGLAIVADSSA